MEEKKYSDEMRGALFAEEERKNEKTPMATGTVTISGVKLRVAMWPSRVAGGTGKGAGKKYWPISVEYLQGAQKFLVACSPADVTVTGASTTVAPGTVQPADAAQPVEDMPF